MRLKNKKINFNNPIISSDQLKCIKQLRFSRKFSSKGLFEKKIKKNLTKTFKCKEVILTNSCTAALEIAAYLVDIKPGDEVIVPSYTFVSSANAFSSRGATPVFVDIDKKTMNISSENIKKAITKKTKAVIIVHYAGVSCEMNEIMKLKNKYNFYLIEDAAQSIMSKYKNKFLGTFGDMSTFSFHETKNIHCGEGGALVINNNKFVKRANIIRDKGTNRNDFDKKIVKKYTWVDFGSNYGLSEINCAFLYPQIKKKQKITNYRRKLFFYYHKKLEILEKKKLLIRPHIPKYTDNNGHLYYIHVPQKVRNNLINFMNSKKIKCVLHYVPLHLSPFGKKIGKISGDLNNTLNFSKSILRLPLHLYLNKNHIDRVVNYLKVFFLKKINTKN